MPHALSFSTTVSLLDGEDRVFAVLVGQPRAGDWSTAVEEARAALNHARGELAATRKTAEHRRGCFTALSSGISFGGGQKEVCNVSHNTKIEAQTANNLLNNPAIKRLAGFGDAAFRVYAPRLHKYYDDTMEALLAKHPHLRRNFTNSVFAAATFNLGPQTVTFRHTDHQNLPAGWCAITALGEYDYTAGGHLILWDARMIVEFPPGSTILMPSALIRHSNTTVQPHEVRYSLTQYSAGGLFRWVECGFRTQKSFKAAGGSYRVTGEERWRQGLDMFSTWGELRPDRGGDSP
ncbi:hypothetical protein C2E23DRAFT_738068 [Lenzites betulinus]|nr:hypothetical protein C2E23DRAFT_738068 [Lenzites betulinus]